MRRGAQLLVVVGGDGSVNEVVNGIAGADDVEIAVIPRGTGWDFARSLGIPRKLAAAVEIALTGETRAIDLGLVTYRSWAGAEGRAHFANVGSAGISGAIAKRANETSKALGGKISVLLGDARRLRSAGRRVRCASPSTARPAAGR